MNWFVKNKFTIIRSLFLIPIILVAFISISHVISWYNLSNPFGWAVYLSIAVEIAAMVSLAAATSKIKGGVWFVFGVVTLIQFIGNIFFSYKEINPNSPEFKQWIELVGPLFENFGTQTTDYVGHKRWLALLSGGLLPIISLTSLHFFVKYDKSKSVVEEEPQDEIKTDEIEKVVKSALNHLRLNKSKTLFFEIGERLKENLSEAETTMYLQTHMAMREQIKFFEKELGLVVLKYNLFHHPSQHKVFVF